jgi:hypothetical protein
MKKAVYTTLLELESGGSQDNYHPVSVLAMRVLEKLPDYDRLAVKPIERSPHELAFDEILWDLLVNGVLIFRLPTRSALTSAETAYRLRTGGKEKLEELSRAA